MEFSEFLKKISFNKEYNPFNSAFSKEKLLTLLQDSFNQSFNINFIDFLLLNSDAYNSFCNLTETIKESSQFRLYYILALTIYNHDSIYLFSEINKQLEKKRITQIPTSEDYKTIKINTPVSDFSVNSFSDAFTDTLDLMFNMLYSDDNSTKKTPLLTEDFILSNLNLISFHNASQEINFIKSFYEKICFENFNISKENNNYIITEGIPDYQLYRDIGFNRIEQNIAMSTHRIATFPLQDAFIGNYDIETVSLNTLDEIEISYKKRTVPIVELEIYYKFFISTVTMYHSHLTKEEKDSLLRISQIWCCIIYLTSRIINDNSSLFESNTIIPYSKYQFKIKAKHIVELVTKLTKFDTSIILSGIKLFENDGRPSFWDCPLLRVNNYFFISIHSLRNVFIPYLIDT